MNFNEAMDLVKQGTHKARPVGSGFTWVVYSGGQIRADDGHHSSYSINIQSTQEAWEVLPLFNVMTFMEGVEWLRGNPVRVLHNTTKPHRTIILRPNGDLWCCDRDPITVFDIHDTYYGVGSR